MIEIEKKFHIQPHQLAALKTKATFIKERSFTDIYYDTHDHRFTLRNQWLRSRQGQFELKAGIRNPAGICDRYDEITDLPVISQRLGIPIPFEKSVEIFATITTRRAQYRLESFSIDLDSTDFGDLTYSVAEIELQVHSEAEIPRAEQEIIRIAKELGWETCGRVPAKLSAYLAHKRPAHYRALVQAGVIQI